VDLPDSVKNGLEIIPVSRMDEVLARALTHELVPIEWDEASVKPGAPAIDVEDEAASNLTAH
jgi:ATP-dependent Lon protease